MTPEAHLYLHRQRTTELPGAEPESGTAGTATGLRARLGWTLVHVGLRLAVPARPAAALSS
ncbi:hypothetical protein ACIBI4_20720 [Streptomyces sp. NPDC050418]|uniref:hypothetical protein n=1 Tax=Streptomyces sp. NPDC050418 TaxID=3365612 RepID=UPI0037A502B9